MYFKKKFDSCDGKVFSAFPLWPVLVSDASARGSNNGVSSQDSHLRSGKRPGAVSDAVSTGQLQWDATGSDGAVRAEPVILWFLWAPA